MNFIQGNKAYQVSGTARKYDAAAAEKHLLFGHDII
jgi:hypothetical protein